jgi:hypothetical protein
METTIRVGVVLEGGASLVSPHTCRNGHVLTATSTWRSKTSGDTRCRECRRAHKPLKTRQCKRCHEPFSGMRGKYCSLCVTTRLMDDMERSPKPMRTRTCVDCEEAKPLMEFERDVYAKDRKGVQQYSDRCADCRDDDEDDDEFPGVANSPYEKARRQIETIFGLPARLWINTRGHVLSDLHFVRMLAIQHSDARRAGITLTRPEMDTRSRHLWPRLIAAGLTARSHHGARRLPFQLRTA